MYTLIKLLLLIHLVLGDENPTVKIKLGELRGKWEKSAKGRIYASFKGVPYATPPVGKYRFAEASKMKPWAGVWNANRPPTICMQFDPFEKMVKGQEDCLFLNVYVPRLNSDALLPVIVFIHGGAFLFGGSNIYGPERLMDWDMIIVTINYRLGPLGFFSTGDRVVSGNAGLKDQNLALRWVQDNIRAFKGNPENVILYGSSAGAASVHYHFLSPQSQWRFHRGILSSGSALAPWAQQANPRENAKTLSSLVGCPSNNSQAMVDCLRSRPGEMIVNAQGGMLNWRAALFTQFTPVIEPKSCSAFIDKHPNESTKAGSFVKAPLLVSVTSEEGLYPAAFYQSDPTILPQLEDNWSELSSYIFNYYETLPANRRPEVAAKIKAFYFNNRTISQETFPQLIKALGDRNFYVNVGDSVQLFVAKSSENLYLYRYSFRGEKSFSNFFSGDNKDYGVSHTDDLFRVFKTPNFELHQPDDLAIIDVLINIIYTFSTTGQPTVPDGTIWPPVTPGPEINLLEISSPNDIKMTNNTNFGNKSFWRSLGLDENEQRSAVRNTNY